jgi:hypothetical protein
MSHALDCPDRAHQGAGHQIRKLGRRDRRAHVIADEESSSRGGGRPKSHPGDSDTRQGSCRLQDKRFHGISGKAFIEGH